MIVISEERFQYETSAGPSNGITLIATFVDGSCHSASFETSSPRVRKMTPAEENEMRDRCIKGLHELAAS